MTKRFLVGCAMVAVLAAGSVLADEGLAKRPWRLSAGLSADYSDNRGSVATGKVDNTDLALWIGFNLLLEREDSYMLDLGYSPSLRWRTDPSPSQNDAEVYHDLRLDGWYKPTRRVRLHMMEGLNFTDDPAVDQGGGTIRRDASFLLNRANVGAEMEVSRRMRADVSGYSMVKRYNDDTFAKVGDEDSLSGTMAIGWIMDRMSTLSFYGSYGTFAYPGDSAAQGDRGFVFGEVGISLRKEFSKTIQVRADAAFKRLDYDAAELGSDQSPCGYLTLKVAPSPRLRLSGSAGYVLRDADVAFFASQRYTDLSLRGEWDALIPKRLTVGVTGGYRMGDYKTDALLAADRDAVSALSGQETMTIVGVDVTYRVRETLAVSVVAQYEDVSSDVSLSFDRNSAGIRTRYDF